MNLSDSTEMNKLIGYFFLLIATLFGISSILLLLQLLKGLVLLWKVIFQEWNAHDAGYATGTLLAYSVFPFLAYVFWEAGKKRTK